MIFWIGNLAQGDYETSSLITGTTTTSAVLRYATAKLFFDHVLNRKDGHRLTPIYTDKGSSSFESVFNLCPSVAGEDFDL